jgi:hypothetical protein
MCIWDLIFYYYYYCYLDFLTIVIVKSNLLSAYHPQIGDFLVVASPEEGSMGSEVDFQEGV